MHAPQAHRIAAVDLQTGDVEIKAITRTSKTRVVSEIAIFRPLDAGNCLDYTSLP
jgi:hypothetical protein